MSLFPLFKKISISAVCATVLATQIFAAKFTVNTTTPTGPGSLDYAIGQANGSPGKDTIVFNIPGSQLQVISLGNTLPCLTDNAGVLIDGFSQPGSAPNNNTPDMGSNAMYKIMITQGTSVPVGLCINSDNNTIQGIVITGFGTATFSSSEMGIDLASGGGAVKDNFILGCMIGLDTTSNGNGYQDAGIRIGPNAFNNYIGNGTPAGLNVISGNSSTGIELAGTTNGVRGNLIGTNKYGNGMPTGPDQQDRGITLNGNSNTIGGTAPSDKNTISCNMYYGIDITGSSNLVFGNFLGTKTAGNSSAGNQAHGIKITGNSNTIGGPNTGEGNLISGNSQAGIKMEPAAGGTLSNKIQGNLIGTDLTGMTDVGNLLHGIKIDGSSSLNPIKFTLIGGVNVKEENVIAFNDSSGITMIGYPFGGNETRYNKLVRNRIYANNNIGIELYSDANNMYSAPAISAAWFCGGVGNVKGVSNPQDTIEIFKDAGNQAREYLATVFADAVGNWSASGLALELSKNVIATATNWNTSKFSNPASVTADLVINPSKFDISCNGYNDGQGYANITGGTSPFSYEWNSVPVQNGFSAYGLPAGLYTVTVTDNNACTMTATVDITEPPLLDVTASKLDVSCYMLGNGTASATVTGGMPGYTFSWTTSDTTSMIDSLFPGTYSVTVYDSKGCWDTVSVYISEPLQLTSSMSATNETCVGLANGTATATPNGGTAPYSYLWSNSQTGQVATSLTGLSVSGALYTVTVTDMNACSTTNFSTIWAPSAALTATELSHMNPTCNGTSNGSLQVQPNGGTSPYSYAWTPTGGSYSATGYLDVWALGAATYTVTVTDANSCTATITIDLTAPAPIIINTTVTDVSCNGYNDGAASAAVTGGTSPYSYYWSPSSQVAPTASNLIAGGYTVTVTDNNSCTSSSVISITEPAALTLNTSSTDVLCTGGTSGSATSTVAGGRSPYTYSWSSGAVTDIATNLSASTYTVTVTDSKGCTVASSTTVNEPPVALTSSISSSTDVSCYGGNDGSATVTPAGGISPYAYTWSPAGGTAAGSQFLTPGTYTVTVSDANLCTSISTATINTPSQIITTPSATDLLCNGSATGSATIAASGGTGTLTYQWQGGPASSTYSGLAAGTYTVSVTDYNTCTVTATISITEPLAMSTSMTSTNATVYLASDGTATASAFGGISPYTYSWSTAPVQTGATATGLSAATYTVSITDMNSCSIQDIVVITQPSVYSIAGRILRNNYTDTVKSGNVYLIRYTATNTAMMYIDTTNIGSTDGSYLFTNVVPDQYLILADADTSIYPYSIVTYYGDSLVWNKAVILTLTSDTSLIDISAYEMPTMAGSGHIKGMVQEGTSYQKTTGPGDPLKGITVMLIDNTSGDAVKTDITDSTGTFDFTDVANGTYHLYADQTGVPVDLSVPTTNFTVSATDTLFDNIDVYVDSNLIYMATPTLIKTSNPAEIISLTAVYPTPTSGQVYLELMNNTQAAQDLSYVIYDLRGAEIIHSKTIHLGTGAGTISIDVASLPNGTYMLGITSASKEFIATQALRKLLIVK